MKAFAAGLIALCIATAVAADDRDADRAAIRAHIDKIFNAYINADCATIRATHSPTWIGFPVPARTIVHGIDGYMSYAGSCSAAKGAGGGGHMTSYKILDIDYDFHGDIALIAYVAETSGTNWSGTKLRSLDVYEKQKGDWIQIGSNISLHPDMIESMRKPAKP